MSAPEAPPPGSSDATPSRVPSPELEIKDAPLIFGQVWNRLVQERGVENMVFPKEIMWLGGAPGSGKGTNTPLILRERGLTAPPIVVSDLLDTPEMRALKDRGQFVGDREVIEALLRKLLEPEYQTGVVVDGFPRTKVQAEAVKLLHVERSINAEFQYQSSLELGQATFDIIHHIPVASELTLYARQELVRRLDSYEHATAPLFKQAAAFIEQNVMPVIVRQVLAGRCVVKTDHTLFESDVAVDMVLDILSERGYHAVYQERRIPVPESMDLRTGAITCQDRIQHRFEIFFHPPEIRRGH